MHRLTRPCLLWIALWLLILVPRVGNLLAYGGSNRPLGELENTAACLATNGYLGDPYGFKSNTGPSAHIGPLYAGFLAGLYYIFGTAETGHTVQAACSILVVGIGISLLVPLGFHLFQRKAVGWLAAAAMAVLPFSVNFLQVRGQWEQHWVFTATNAYLLLLLRMDRTGWVSRRTAMFFGVITGLGVLLNPLTALIAVLFGLWQLIVQQNRLRVFLLLLLSAALALFMISGWQIRNVKQLGGWCFVRSNFGLELYIGNNEDANGFTQVTRDDDPDSPFRKRHPMFNEALREEYIQRGELGFMAARQHEAQKWIESHQARFVELTLIRLRLFWFPSPMLWSAQKSGAFTPELRSAMYSGNNLLAFIGWLILLRRNWRTAGIVAAVLVGLSAAYAITHVEIRYLFPLHGICLVLGSGCIVTGIARFRATRSSEKPQ